MTIEMIIPTKVFENLRNTILGHFFMSEEPLLTRHVAASDDAYTCASFFSEHAPDIRFVESILPQGSLHFFMQ